tara:strand:+ start:909 stop:1340 length:432 start_codon:yes stop_codon:yes gene_type:complete
MQRQQTHHIPDSPPKFDDSEAFDSEKHASRRDQSRPDRGLGFVPVDEALNQGELFGEKVEPSDEAQVVTASGQDKTSGKDETPEKAFPKKPDPDKFKDKAPEDHDSEDVDEALEETFPASDPASYSPGTATPSNIKDKDAPKK